jgi:hypothetical protein
MKEQPKYVLLDKRQTVGESLVSDGWTFGLLLLCIWASQGSKWWTFCTALMFLAFMLVKAAGIVGDRQHKFKSLDELEAWTAKERSNG